MTPQSPPLQRLAFALITVAFCVLLAFRPIPVVDSVNDTERYVTGLHQYCTSSFFSDLINQEISYQIFYGVASPACATGSDGIFLFEVALYLPLMFLLFSAWRKGTLFWACSLFFSVFGLELMTNAMRQGLAMLMFFGALSLVNKHLVKALLLGILAVATHSSVLAFLPLLLWLSARQRSRRVLLAVAASALLFAAAGALIYREDIIEFFENVEALRTTFGQIYANNLKTSFLLFMTLPLYFVYGLRRFLEKEHVSGLEHKGVLYSTAVLAISLVAFPYITYRFAILAVAMQIFLVSIAEQQSSRIGGIALAGFMVHLFVMLFLSTHFEVLIYG